MSDWKGIRGEKGSRDWGDPDWDPIDRNHSYRDIAKRLYPDASVAPTVERQVEALCGGGANPSRSTKK